MRKAYGVCVRRKKVWRSHTSCGFTAYATVKEVGIPPPKEVGGGCQSLFNKDHKTTSKMFVSVGIIGIKANNYLVVFDMDNVTIVNKEEI